MIIRLACWAVGGKVMVLWIGEKGCLTVIQFDTGLSEDCSQVDKIITLPTVKPSLLPWNQATFWVLVTNIFPSQDDPASQVCWMRCHKNQWSSSTTTTEQISCQFKVWKAPESVSAFWTAADERRDCFNDLQTAGQCWICSNVTVRAIFQPLGGAIEPEKDFLRISGDVFPCCTCAIYVCACALTHIHSPTDG